MFSKFSLPLILKFYALTDKQEAKYRQLGYIQPEAIVRNAGCILIDTELGVAIEGQTYDELLASVRKLWTEVNKDFFIIKVFERRDIPAYIGVTVQSDYTLELWESYQVDCAPIACYAVPLSNYTVLLNKDYLKRIPIRKII